MRIQLSSQKLVANDLWLASVLVAAVNMLWPSVSVTYSALDTFSADFLLSNWLILFAIMATMYFITQATTVAVTLLDWVVFGCTVLLALWPIKYTSTLALTGISIYFFYIIRRTEGHTTTRCSVQHKDREDYLLAAASILFALSFSRLWSPLLLRVFANYFEQFDVFLLGNLLQTKTLGNTIDFLFEPNQQAFVAMGCTSFANLSSVVLLWLMVLRMIRIQPRLGIELRTLMLLLIVAIGINTLRISLMITTSYMYELVHGPLGASITAFLLTLCSVLFGNWAAKRAR